MRLFTIDPTMRRPSPVGITVTTPQDAAGPALYGSDFVVPLTDELLEPFQGGLTTLNLEVAKLLDGKEDGAPLRFGPALPEELRKVQEGRSYGPCCIHVLPVKGGAYSLLSAVPYEKVVEKGPRKFVERGFVPVQDAEGVEIFYVAEGGQEFLMRLLPGACFIVRRNIHFGLGEDEPEQLLVHWDGNGLTLRQWETAASSPLSYLDVLEESTVQHTAPPPSKKPRKPRAPRTKKVEPIATA